MTPEPAHHALADWIRERHARGQRVFGVCGSQGSGKSTVSRWLTAQLHEHGLRAWVLSIDDLYLPRAARAELAHTTHPLLQTRGVPGTHDVELGHALLDAALASSEGQSFEAPTFEKARDDRAATPVTISGRVDVVLFEGWCVGVPPQPAAALDDAVNALERDRDPDQRWRRYVNTQLAEPYARLFQRLDAQIFLAAPSFETVYDWRWQQEQETIAKHGGRTDQTLTPESLRTFLQHYERLTTHAINVMPQRSDAVLKLHTDHTIRAWELQSCHK